MIYNIGFDLIAINRIQKAVDKWGENFLNKVFTPLEQEYCLPRKKRYYSCLAMRFAAKEAAAKAFGTGFRCGLGFFHIEVISDDFGAPKLIFYGPARQFVKDIGVTAHVSLSDDGLYGAAVVILEQR